MAGGKYNRKSGSPTAFSSRTTPPQRGFSSPRHYSPPSGLDGNRDPSDPRGRSGSQSSGGPSSSAAKPVINNKNLDIGFAGASLMKGYNAPKYLPPRPSAPNKGGRIIPVKLNSWQIISFPSQPVFQYDVIVDKGIDKRGLIRRIWKSGDVQSKVGESCIFDGFKLAWSMVDYPTGPITVSLKKLGGNAQGNAPGKQTDEFEDHSVILKKTTKVDFALLRAFLQRKADFDNGCLEAINFLDHLIRERPSQRFTSIKRNFFSNSQESHILGNGMIAFKGTHAAIRMALGTEGPCLSINVDVANSAFWIPNQLCQAAVQFLNLRSVNDLQNLDDNRFQHLWKNMRLLKLALMTKLPGSRDDLNNPGLYEDCREVSLRSMVRKTAKQHSFKLQDGTETNVLKYFQSKYNLRLNYPDLPLVVTQKDEYMPMEVLFIKPFTKYSGKLSDQQTRNMLQFAVTLPDKRWADLDRGRVELDWSRDKYLAKYGLRINDTPTTVNACVLPNPKVQFASKGQDATVDPRTSGRWDLRGKKFVETNKVPLKAWGVAVMPGRHAPDKVAVDKFVKLFVETYGRHGGRIQNPNPVIIGGNPDAGQCVYKLGQDIVEKGLGDPQLLIVIVNSADSMFYGKLKRSCDCRFGVASQVVQASHVIKASPQYISNVCLKVNAKLGGLTAKAVGPKTGGTYFSVPTMVLGADVTHTSLIPDRHISVAAITMSFDKTAVRYAANAQGNGVRIEIMEEPVIKDILEGMYKNWCKTVGGGSHPQNIFYFRDGVSESQYQEVLDGEVKALRSLIASWGGKPLFTVIIATKRHHVRFFPQQNSGDKNNNPLPGTLVESGVTHPFEYDFFLNAHVAIKGTARPVHYHVILDEAKMDKDKLQTMIYENSYQYVRSTTPVSLHPAVYYAHLTAAKGGMHQRDEKQERPDERETIIPLHAKSGIQENMWFV